jgi:hypothetical protein
MSKKQRFLSSEQSRDKHPEREQAGQPGQGAEARGGPADVDRQEPGTGKVANDRNKMGQQEPTQLNEGRRTPESRHDRPTLGTGPHKGKGSGVAGGGSRGAG